MPPPIVPQPITAAELMGKIFVSLGTSGIFKACLSEKNIWIKEELSLESWHNLNNSLSFSSP